MSQICLIPIWLDWSGRTVLVIGLGQVGQRRALLFQRAGATVVGVDPIPQNKGPDWGELIRNGLELRSEPYDESVFDELTQFKMRPDLVLTCASAEVNARVVRDSKSRSHWVVSGTNSSDEPANAHLGAVASGEIVQVAIRSGNVAPALSVALRDQIVENLLPAADRIAAEAARLRPELLGRVEDPDNRRELLALFGSSELLSLESGNPGAGVAQIRKRIRDSLDQSNDF